MCGITGFFNFNSRNQEDINKRIISDMNTSLNHRGPDDHGTYIKKDIVLGHTRLIVLDPVGGIQPMIKKRGNKNIALVYNGEIYNSLSLRSELEAKGHVFSSKNSDTEVLLIAYLEWGEKCVEYLNGIFAFAIWDERKESLFLARDRLGVKPLFYYFDSDVFIFASELKALLAHPKVSARLDSSGLAEIFIMGPSRSPGNGLFKDVKEVLPSECIAISKGDIERKKYWKLISRTHEDDEQTTIAKVRALMEDAVELQLISDVPLGTFLSGGLDSSIITALAAKKVANLKTFSVDYEDNHLYFKSSNFQPESDSYFAQYAAKFIGSKQEYIFLDQKKLAYALQDSMLANDYPGMADIDSSLLLFCQEVKKHSTVALSGECADEIFGGYPWFQNNDTLFANKFPWIRSTEERVRFLHPDLINFISPQNYLSNKYQEAIAEVPKLIGEKQLAAKYREMFYITISRFMPTLLDRKDRMSMASGLEVRVPFSDHRILEYVWNIPWEIKNMDNKEKGLLRRAFADLLPDSIINRRKSPYPKTHHPLYLSIVRSQLLEILEEERSLIKNILNIDLLKKALLSEKKIFSDPWFGQLMGDAQYMAYLFQFIKWFKHYRVSIT